VCGCVGGYKIEKFRTFSAAFKLSLTVTVGFVFEMTR
jgi:hypothetical protein